MHTRHTREDRHGSTLYAAFKIITRTLRGFPQDCDEEGAEKLLQKLSRIVVEYGAAHESGKAAIVSSGTHVLLQRDGCRATAGVC